MEVRTFLQQAIGLKPKVQALDIPWVPDNAHGVEMLRVVEDFSDNDKTYIELNHCMDVAESWGMFLAEVARAIAKEYGEVLQAHNGKDDVLTGIFKGFLHNVCEGSK